MGAAGQIAIFALQVLIQEEPELVAALQAIFSKATVSLADLDALRAGVAAETYQTLVPDTQLSPPTPPTV